MTREHEPTNPSENPDLTPGKEIETRKLLQHIAITEKAMVTYSQSVARLNEIMAGCGVNERRARRLIKAVNSLWHYRAKAFGTTDKARARILPLVQGIFEQSLVKGDMKAALGALKLQADICGLSKADVIAMPIEAGARQPIAEDTQEVADRVLNRLLSVGSHGGNGKSNGDGRPQA